MPDISLCSNFTCPLRNNCYRATAVPNEYMQSYAVFNLNADGTCNWFWDNKEHKKDDKLRKEIR